MKFVCADELSRTKLSEILFENRVYPVSEILPPAFEKFTQLFSPNLQVSILTLLIQLLFLLLMNKLIIFFCIGLTFY